MLKKHVFVFLNKETTLKLLQMGEKNESGFFGDERGQKMNIESNCICLRFFSEKFSWKDITLIETGIIGIIFIIIMIIAFFSCIKRHKEQGKTSKMQCNKL